METTTWRVGKKRLRAWLGGLLHDGRRVIGPVQRAGLRIFRPLRSADEADLEAGKTRWSPKEFLFPRTETLYHYTLEAEGPTLQDPPLTDDDQVLVGLRCCDAAGIARLDEVFLYGPVRDPFYAHRRQRTTIVAFACAEAEPDCFCAAVGGSPMGTEGVDLLALPFGAYWLLRAVTEKGQALAAEEWKPASPEDCALAEEPVRQVAERLAQRAVPGAGARPLEQRFDSPLWREVARRCLGCSICAYVCPSCSCFDVHHEGNAWGGREIRSWDACTYTRFTLHASGHDPRGTRDARYRQRVLHKFAYVAPDADEEPSRCVGCGRCIAQCPVGIDIHEAMARVLAASREGDTDGRA